MDGAIAATVERRLKGVNGVSRKMEEAPPVITSNRRRASTAAGTESASVSPATRASKQREGVKRVVRLLGVGMGVAREASTA